MYGIQIIILNNIQRVNIMSDNNITTHIGFNCITQVNLG